MPESISIRELFTVPLIEIDGVFDAQHDVATLSEEFLTGADVYDQRYFSGDVLRRPLGEAFADLRVTGAPLVLDLGAGSGTSVIATLDLLPQAQIVATDLSPQLLALMQRHLLDRRLSDRCSLVRIDLSRSNILRGDSFDLVVGNAILHHLLHPQDLLRQICQWLRPGGHAVLIEPFAAGQFCFALLCERLAVDATCLGLPTGVGELLSRFAHDIRVRLSHSVAYEYLEDKWLFTRSQLEAAVAGVGEVSVTPFDASPGLLAREFAKLMEHGLGLDRSELSGSVWETVQMWDAGYAPLAQELYLLGRIVVTRL